MPVSVENLNGLERKLTISVGTEQIEEKVKKRLQDLSRKVNVPGFRPGKAPMKIVNQRYSENVRLDVAKELIESTLFDALKEHDMTPAGYPSVEPGEIAEGKDFEYTAIVEVFPTITLKEFDKNEIEQVAAQVTDSDLAEMLKKLQEQQRDWIEVDRAPQKGDKVSIDFKGFVDNEPFAGGEATDYELELGSGNMIPGFEDGIIGGELNKAFDIHPKFPEEYHHKDLSGKEAVFNITIKKVMEPKLPELDDAFAEKFNIGEGGLDALKADIKQNMTRELERRIDSMNRDHVFKAFREANPIDLPKALVDQEIESLKHAMYHRIFGHEHHDNEKIPDFPRELFEDQAKQRVHLGLLFSEYVKLHDLKADKERVDALIEKLSSAYEKPESLKKWYYSNKEQLAQVESMVVEQMAAEKMCEHAKLVTKEMSYDEVMNPKKDTGEQA